MAPQGVGRIMLSPTGPLQVDYLPSLGADGKQCEFPAIDLPLGDNPASLSQPPTCLKDLTGEGNDEEKFDPANLDGAAVAKAYAKALQTSKISEPSDVFVLVEKGIPTVAVEGLTATGGYATAREAIS